MARGNLTRGMNFDRVGNVPDSMVYAGKTPWHVIGNKVDNSEGKYSPNDFLNMSGASFTVSKRQAFFFGSPQAIEIPEMQVSDSGTEKALIVQPDHIPHLVKANGIYILQRDDNNESFGAVGEDYTPIQNYQMFKFLEHFCAEHGLLMETAGVLQGGKYVWGLAKLPYTFALFGSDQHECYMLVMVPHGIGSAVAGMTGVRVVCGNTLMHALDCASGFFRKVHRGEFDDKTESDAIKMLEGSHEAFGTFERQMRLLEHAPDMSESMLREIAYRAWVPHFQKDMEPDELLRFPENTNRVMKKLFESQRQAPGAMADKLIGIWHATTHYLDWRAGRTAENRMQSQTASTGNRANIKYRVLQFLLDTLDKHNAANESARLQQIAQIAAGGNVIEGTATDITAEVESANVPEINTEPETIVTEEPVSNAPSATSEAHTEEPAPIATVTPIKAGRKGRKAA